MKHRRLPKVVVIGYSRKPTDLVITLSRAIEKFKMFLMSEDVQSFNFFLLFIFDEPPT
jgi:hypothetical protein